MQDFADAQPRERIRVVSLVQAQTVTGPMKPLLMFIRNIQVSRTPCAGISLSAVTTIRTRGKRASHSNAFLKAAEAAGLAVETIPERFPFDPAILPRLASHLTETNPQIVESHDCKSHFLVWLLKKTHAIPQERWVAFHHGYTKTSARISVYQQLDRLSLPEADQVITVCAPFAKQLKNCGVQSGKIRIIANAIESRVPTTSLDRRYLKQRLGIPPDDPVILSVGRLSAEKGHAPLITALRLVLKEEAVGNVHLVLVGDGPEMNGLRAAAANLGDHVKFVGQVEDPWPYYCMADVFALPSFSEGSPLALFEAMSAALPIVASSVGGIPETLCDRISALLVAPSAINELATSLRLLLRDRHLARRLGQAAHAAAGQFTPERYARERISIYESLIRPNSS